MKKIVFSLVILLIFVQSSIGQTIIPDNTNVSGNWSVENSPYSIEGRVIIPNGETLTIEPGVEIRLKAASASASPSWFDFNAGNVGVIRVQGTISADGTAANPILFTRNGSSGYWGAILIDENASNTSSFQNCIIEYAKETRNVPGITSVVSFNGGISVFKKELTLNSIEFRNNYISGLQLREVSTSLDVAESLFFDNGANALEIIESIANVINTTFYNNSIISSGAVSAIRSSNSNVYLVGNLIYNNDDFGIFITNGGNHYVVNNTIYGNSQGIRVENGANTYIYNSIIQNNNLNFATSNPVGAIIEMQYSLTDDAEFPTNVTDINGNILGSLASFTSENTNDFSLQNTSPCIDSGTSETTGLNIPDVDVLGNPRIDSEIIDMGAFEFQQDLSVRSVDPMQKIRIYPNPTSSSIQITFEGYHLAKLYRINGSLISTHRSNTIDLSKHPNGIYLLKIESKNGETITKKIIKK